MALLILFQDSILSITLPVYFHSFCISVYPSHFIEKKKKKRFTHILHFTENWHPSETLNKKHSDCNALHVLKKPYRIFDITNF